MCRLGAGSTLKSSCASPAAYGGRITVWQDGTRLWDLDGVKTRYENGDERWTVNNYSGGLTPTPATLYIDDATVATSRVHSP